MTKEEKTLYKEDNDLANLTIKQALTRNVKRPLEDSLMRYEREIDDL